MTTTPPNLGLIIPSATARQAIYGAYVLAILAVGGVQVGFSSIQFPQPNWLIAAIAVLAYLGAPIGTLAIVNSKNTPPAATITYNMTNPTPTYAVAASVEPIPAPAAVPDVITAAPVA